VPKFDRRRAWLTPDVRATVQRPPESEARTARYEQWFWATLVDLSVHADTAVHEVDRRATFVEVARVLRAVAISLVHPNGERLLADLGDRSRRYLIRNARFLKLVDTVLEVDPGEVDTEALLANPTAHTLCFDAPVFLRGGDVLLARTQRFEWAEELFRSTLICGGMSRDTARIRRTAGKLTKTLLGVLKRPVPLPDLPADLDARAERVEKRLRAVLLDREPAESVDRLAERLLQAGLVAARYPSKEPLGYRRKRENKAERARPPTSSGG
jgi:hypothetical protein